MKLYLRVVRLPPPTLGKHAGRNAIKRIEIIDEKGAVVGELGAIVDVNVAYPLDGVVALTVSTVMFDETTEIGAMGRQ